MKRLVFYVLSLLVVVGAVEIGSFLFILSRYKVRLSYLEDYLQSSTSWAAGALNWQKSLLTHPYFGFVFDQSNSQVNNMGFQDLHSFPIEKSSEQIVVGIFGGSLAQSFAAHRPSTDILVRAIRESIPAYSKRDVIVANFAIGGMKQPQQFFIFSYFLDNIDLAINIDGFNEIEAVHSPYPAFPSDFPSQSAFLFQNNIRYIAQLGRVEWLRSIVNSTGQLPRQFAILRYSQTYYFLWRMISEVSEKWQKAIVREIGNMNSEYRPPLGKGPVMSPEEARMERVNNWTKYTRRQGRLAQTYAVPAYFFIQPNQHAKNNKVFSAKEIEGAKPGLFSELKLAYSELESSAMSLRQEGHLVFSTTAAFDSIAETVYVDECCHINELGNLTLANYIAAILRKNPSSFQKQNMKTAKRKN